MRVEGTDYAVVFVTDYPRAVEFYGGTLGLERSQDYGKIPGGEFETGNLTLQVLDAAAVGKFLERKGPGLHHVAYAVDDIDSTLENLKAAGIELIDSEPRVGIRDSRVAFLHPRSTGGVLTEIVEPAGGH